jgi:putative peptidoglycan lipid II flippase
VSNYWGAILNASGVFRSVAIAPIAVPLTALVGLLLLVPRYGIDALAWSTVAGYAVETACLGVAMHRRGLPVLPLGQVHPQAAVVARQYGYLLGGAVLVSASMVIDQSMATWLGPGSVSVLSYGYKLVAVLLGTISLGISTAVFPDFCRLAAAGDINKLARTLRGLVRMLLLTSIPLTALFIVGSRPIVQLLFERGAVTAGMADSIAWVQACYLLQVPVYLVGVLGARALNALEENRTVFRIAGTNLAVNVAGNLVLMQWWGVAGIALSTSLVYLTSAVLLHAALRRRLRTLSVEPPATAEHALAA